MISPRDRFCDRLLFSVLALALAAADVARAATFVVVNANATGIGSLRQALLDANTSPDLDTITFNIPGGGIKTILPTSALPQANFPVIIDGTTQPGYSGTPLIELSGLSAGSANGLLLLGGNSTVRGLAINRFALSGIRIETAGSNRLERVFLGCDPSGTVARGNGTYGLVVFNSPGNLIGGTTPGVANVIGSNGIAGVLLNGADATDNHLEGNLIGTDVTGRLALANGANGIHILGAPGNWIGGPTPGSGNVISGNRQSGVYVNGADSTDNRLLRNFIGTAIEGTNALPNVQDGVTIAGSAANFIGAPGLGNLVSGNLAAGITITGTAALDNVVAGNYVGTDVTGRRAISNATSGILLFSSSRTTVGGAAPGAGNLVSGNGGSGIRLVDRLTADNVVLGNRVGVDVFGTNAVPNGLSGVSIAGPRNQIGGAEPGAGNLLSGNAQNGIYLSSLAASNNVIAGNRVGVTAAGNARRANGIVGIYVDGAPRNTIGGRAPGEGNVVSGNGQSGVLLVGAGATGNLVLGNRIGTDATGTLAIANGADGVGVSNAPGNFVGGPEPEERNVVSGNNLAGVFVGGVTASNNVIAGNFIGTDWLGRRAIPNLNPGIYISAPRTRIGGSTPGAGNLISGNQNVAISIGDPVSVDTVVQGNWIGLQSDGVSPLSNRWHGVEVLASGLRTVIGGGAPGAGNRIANALTPLYSGIRIRDGCVSNSIRGNLIFGNAGLGIDLGVNGISANLPANPGPTTLANRGQNFPMLTSATNRFRTVIQGTLSSGASQPYTLDFFANPVPDANAVGEGQRWLGATNVTTSAAGTASFTVVFTNTTAVTGGITATATDAGGNTSEFSTNAPVSTGIITDTDGDGMPDDFELAWGFNPNSPADAGLDADGDGASNLKEYQAGTNARNAGDSFRILTSYPAGATYWASFNSQPGRTYSLQRATTLPGPWTTVVTNLPGVGGLVWTVDTNRPLPHAYYRAFSSP
jgi:hypothetical protein